MHYGLSPYFGIVALCVGWESISLYNNFATEKL